MTKIEILGTGCPNCQRLEANVRAAVEQLGLDAQVEKVTDIQEIMKRGVMMTPALVIDGKVHSTGKVLPVPELAELLGRVGS